MFVTFLYSQVLAGPLDFRANTRELTFFKKFARVCENILEPRRKFWNT